MKSMDINSQVDFLYNALLEASNGALLIKERFKTNTKKKYISQDVRKLLRKKMKLKKLILKSDKWTKNKAVEEQLEEICGELDLMFYNRRVEMENKAISRINKDPSYFYKYQRRFGKMSEQIGDLKTVKNGKEILVTDNKDKADALNNQYSSVWSQPDENFLVKHSRMFFSACDECVN